MPGSHVRIGETLKASKREAVPKIRSRGVHPPVGPSETTTSIGRRCKRGDTLSRAVLIARETLFLSFNDLVQLSRVGSPDPPGFGILAIAKSFRFHVKEFVSAVIE